MKNFTGINFRESLILKHFAGIDFCESTFSGVKKGIHFWEFGQNSRNSRNFLPAKISSLKVCGRRCGKSFLFPKIGFKIIIIIVFWKMLLWICMFIYLLWVRINNYYLYRNSIIRHKFYSKVSEYPLKPYLVTCKYNLITYNMQKKFRTKGNSIALPKSDVRLDQKQVFFI